MMISRHSGHVWLTCALLILILAGCTRQEAAPAAPPNVLLITLDDFGYNDLGINTGSDSPTPNLDQFARQGLRFTRHYAESSCTPSRVALLTGLYPAKAGAHPYLNGIDAELVTLPEVLREHGYRTHMIGKWHAGDAHPLARPEHQGFDHWYGFMNQLYLSGPHPSEGYRRGRPTYHNPWLEDEQGNLQQQQGHLTDLLTERASDVIQNTTSPWFVYLAYYAPHNPIEPAEAYIERHGDDPAGRYQALKDQLDSNIGRVLNAVRQSEQSNNTLIVIASDNGGTASEWPSNLPYIGKKATYSEGGVRTPLVMAWPDKWPEGVVRDDIAMITDLYPTVLAALNLPRPPGLDGRDLFGDSPPRRLRWYAHGSQGDNFSVLSEDGQWRLSVWNDVARLLFHRDDFVDPAPTNRLPQHSELAGALESDMLSWLVEATEVSGLLHQAVNGQSLFTGQAFRRTPMGGSHSFGLLLRRSDNDSADHQVLRQEGYIDVQSDGTHLSIEVDGHRQQTPLPADDCFALFVTSYLVKDNMIFNKAKSRIRVYINGELSSESNYRNPVLTAAPPTNPLSVSTTAAATLYQVPGTELALSTRVLSAAQISARSKQMQQVCTRA